MADVRVKLNWKGVGELLHSSEMKTACKEQADKALNKLGEGYEVTTHTAPSRVYASIETASYEAMRDNMENNSILKALR